MSMPLPEVIQKLRAVQGAELDEAMTEISSAKGSIDEVIAVAKSCHDNLDDTNHQTILDEALASLGLAKDALDSAESHALQAEIKIADTITSCVGS